MFQSYLLAATALAAVLHPVYSDLVGPTWAATSFYNSNTMATAEPLNFTELTLYLDENGGFGGKSGCNSFTGTYINLTDDSFTVDGPMTSTMMMCTAAEMDQESAYLAIFNGTIDYSVSDDGTGLELTDDVSGQVLANYEEKKVAVVCTDDWTPVCGDDNEVYSNECAALAALPDGATVVYIIDSPPDDLAPGAWCPDTQPPDMCTMDWTPVCGENGKVYSNECSATAAYVETDYVIDSPPADLAAGGWCPDDPPPGICTMDWRPVCGVNGKVYSNECEATTAYVETSYEIVSPADDLAVGDECDPNPPVVCTADWTPVCSDDNEVYSNECTATADGETVAYTIDSPPDDLAPGGWCPDEQPGGMCTLDWTPVCGENGKIYSNECSATAAYVETDYVIDSPPADLAAGGWCPDDPPPGMCTDDWTPVCGVNNIVYSNECEATAAYVETAYSIDSPPADLAAGGWCPDEQPPDMCTADWSPVCGSDGKVYSNACAATAAYVESSSVIASPADDLTAGDDCEYLAITPPVVTTMDSPTTAPTPKPTTSGAMPLFGTSVAVLVMSLLVVWV